MKKRPNILFLMTDEHRADVTGFGGNAIVRTPTLDRLTKNAAVFNNAYTPAPICIPGRQCMMAGQLPSTCDCRYYGQDLDPGHMTFARLFSQYAYRTVCCGKLHHAGTDQMQGWLERPTGDLHMYKPFLQGRCDEEFERYTRPRRKMSQAGEVNFASVRKNFKHVRDDLHAQTACAVISDYYTEPYMNNYPQGEHNPMLLKVSLSHPHYPYMAEKELVDYYYDKVVPYIEENTFDHPFLSEQRVQPGVDASEEQLRLTTAIYYAMIEEADTMFGNVVSSLENVGQDLDDWIIIFTSDHGEMLGEHGIWEKQKFFEASARVPLFIRWPKRFGAQPRMIEENVNLCDLFATLCDMADLPTPEGLDSRSLVPLMEGKNEGWDNETVSQYARETFSNTMIKKDHLKYQHYGADKPEVLFDLKKNPSETLNYIDDPEYADQLVYFRERVKKFEWKGK